MTSYLVFSITHCHVFKALTIGKRVNSKIDPVTMCYQALWRKKVIHFFNEVYNYFVSEFKKLLFWEDTFRISLEESSFLDKKGTLEIMDNYNIIRIFCSHENPIYLSMCETNCLS